MSHMFLVHVSLPTHCISQLFALATSCHGSAVCYEQVLGRELSYRVYPGLE